MASLEEGAFELLRKLSYRTKAVSFAGLLYKCNSILAKVCPIAPSKGIYVEKRHLNTRALQANVQLQWNSITWRKTLIFTPERRTPMGSKCNNGTLSWPKYVQSLCPESQLPYLWCNTRE